MTNIESSARKIGMLGAGFILASHARSVASLPNCKLALIGDASEGRARRAVNDFGFVGSAGSIEAMAASDCDTVHVLLPPVLHEQAAGAMIVAGKSVFVEKPFVLTSAGALRLAEAAESAGVSLGVNHNFLFGKNYQPIRETVRSGGLGRIDAIAVDWHYELPFIKHGPFDNWIVGHAANPLFEIAPHPLAFVLDLVGSFEIDHVDMSDVVELPSAAAIPRRWRILGHAGRTSITITLSFTPGHESRMLYVRGEGGAVHYDYGRDLALRQGTYSSNPMLDTFHASRAATRAYSRQSWPDLRRRIVASLRKQPATAPFEESVFRSIERFYRPRMGVDPRHDARFAAETIRHVERIAALAGYPGPSLSPLQIEMPVPSQPSTVLVVGGTGFIGRALIKQLLAEGRGVRVLSRNARSAALALRGLPVELCEGHHGDAVAVSKAVEAIETVYHLAKCDGRKWQDYVDGDIMPTRVLGEMALAAGVRRFIYTGTIDSYDSANADKKIENQTPVDPRIAQRNLYARSKAACEAVLRELSAGSQLELVIMRPGIVIGAGSPPAHLGVGCFYSETDVEFWGDGSNKLPFVHVDDVAAALVRSACVPGLGGQTLLVTGPPLMSARDYVAALEQYARIKVDARAGRPLGFWLPDLAKELAKQIIRHPNRRRSTLHDWQCRAHRSQYDGSQTEAALDWHPIADAKTLALLGVGEAVSEG